MRINGKPVPSPGERVVPFQDKVEVDGRLVVPESQIVYMVHKPRNIICTAYDDEGRKTVLDLLPDTGKRLYPVGRLDRNSEGLILVTNDGDLANKLTHPRHHIQKEYLVWTREILRDSQIDKMLRGVRDEGEKLRALEIENLPVKGRYYCSRMVLGEGRNRHIRRMCEQVEADVTRIKRIRMAGLDVQELTPGEHRQLSTGEVNRLKRQARD